MVASKTINGAVVSQVSKVLDQKLALLSEKFPELFPEEYLTNVHPFVKHVFTGKVYRKNSKAQIGRKTSSFQQELEILESFSAED